MTLLNLVALKRAFCNDFLIESGSGDFLIENRTSPTYEVYMVRMSERIRRNDLKLV